MTSDDVIARFIKTKPIDPSELAFILAMTPEELIDNLIGMRGGFVFRAYLVERLMELIGGPRGVAVPEDKYAKAIFLAKVNET